MTKSTKHLKRYTASKTLRIAPRQSKSFLTAVVTPSHQSTSSPKLFPIRKAKVSREKSLSLNSIITIIIIITGLFSK